MSILSFSKQDLLVMACCLAVGLSLGFTGTQCGSYFTSNLGGIEGVSSTAFSVTHCVNLVKGCNYTKISSNTILGNWTVGDLTC